MIHPMILQLGRFGLVGLAASALHYCVVIILVDHFAYVPLMANIIGFCCGVQISYWGHRKWTFRGTRASHVSAAPKMIVLQSANFVANESLFYLLLSFSIPYNIALPIVLAVLPLLTYFMSKWWVFP